MTQLEGEQGLHRGEVWVSENRVKVGVIDPTMLVRYEMHERSSSSIGAGSRSRPERSFWPLCCPMKEAGKTVVAEPLPRWHAGYGRHGRLLGVHTSRVPGSLSRPELASFQVGSNGLARPFV